MKVQSIGHYYVPKYNNTGRISAKQNDVTFKAEDYSDRCLTAYRLDSARALLDKRTEELRIMKEFALTQDRTNYEPLENKEAFIAAQEQLVRKLEKEYKELNPSGQGFAKDVEQGKQIIEDYCRKHNLLPNDSNRNQEDPFNGYSMNEIMGVPTGDLSWYNPS